MPADFVRDLCGYRSRNGRPNMSDAHDNLSVRLGARFLDTVGVPSGQIRPDQDGSALEDSIVQRLRATRPDLVIGRSRPAAIFAQYSHLDVFPQFRTNYENSATTLDELSREIETVTEESTRERLRGLASRVSDEVSANAAVVEALKREMPEESLLNIDVAIAIPRPDDTDELAVALSAKWSLRTDRAQDCISQGNKLVAQRRGRMPHFAVVTVEPRPAMLRILADGSGAVDYVYHLDLPALKKTIDAETVQSRNPQTWSPKKTFDRLLHQQRIRDFDDLLSTVQQLPTTG